MYLKKAPVLSEIFNIHCGVSVRLIFFNFRLTLILSSYDHKMMMRNRPGNQGTGLLGEAPGQGQGGAVSRGMKRMMGGGKLGRAVKSST